MANEIKDTPVLKGKDARRFEAELISGKKVSNAEWLRAKRAVETVKIINPSPNSRYDQVYADGVRWLDNC